MTVNTEIMDLLPISGEGVSFMLQWQQETSQQSGGTPRVADVGEPLWFAKIPCNVVTTDEARDCEAALESLQGGIGTFYLHNPRFPYPRLDPAGAILGANNVTIYALGDDNKSLRLAGLPVGYVISRGDFFHFNTGGTRRCFHRFTASGVADGAGRTPSISVVPHLRAGVSTGLAVTLKRPAAEMFLVSGSYDAASIRPALGRIALTAMQVP